MINWIQKSYNSGFVTATKVVKSNLIQNFIRDLSSLRALWNYIYMALYVFLCCWGAVKYPNASLNTAIVTTGSLVGAIFASYVFSKTYEKVKGIEIRPAPKTIVGEPPGEPGGEG